VPAAAVIPAPRAYRNVVAVKKPVVGSVLCRHLVLSVLGGCGGGYEHILCVRISHCLSPGTQSRRHRRGHDLVFTSHVGLDASCLLSSFCSRIQLRGAGDRGETSYHRTEAKTVQTARPQASL